MRITLRGLLLIISIIILLTPLICYGQNEGGWKYLHWGMTVDEVKKAVLANEYKENGTFQMMDGLPDYWFFYTPYDTIDTYNNKGLEVYILIYKYSERSAGRFLPIGFFFNEKLFGKQVAGPPENHNYDELMRILKEKFPDGMVFENKQKSRNPQDPQRASKLFKFKSDNMFVFTTINGSVYYFDPKTLATVLENYQSKLSQSEEHKKKEFKDKF